MASEDFDREGVLPTAVDLFCGAGGAGRGIHAAGFDVVASIDKDEMALRSYNESLPSEPLVHDLRNVVASKIPTKRPPQYVHASPPCKGFSNAGQRDPEDDRNALVFDAVEWIEDLQPAVATMENVPGMTTMRNGTVLDQTEGALRDAGYAVRSRVLNAANYGVPQTRRRLYIIAVREDLPTPARWFPRPTHDSAGSSTLDGRDLAEWVTAREAIDDLTPDAVAADGGVGVVNHNPQDHQESTRERFAEMERGHKEGPTNETRLAGDRPSRTIVGGNGTPPVHYYGEQPEEMRRLTVRECARLQSFPDDHRFVGGVEERYNQVANAVPPLLAEKIAQHLRTEVLPADGE